MSLEVDSPFVLLSRPNRSLGPVARRWVVLAIAATILGIAAGAAAFGAWPVMPFAGLEVALVALAYAGRTVPLGRMLSDEGRRELAERLRGRLPVTAA